LLYFSPCLVLLSPVSPLFPYTTLFRSFFFSSHSQIISTFQPMSISFLWFCLSRSTFRFILGIQYSVLEEGQTNLPQSCLCQKQRSEEHTSELQSRFDLVCRLLLEKHNI